MFEWGSIGFMLGTLVCIIFFGAGVVIGDKRNDTGELRNDSDNRVCGSSSDRVDRSVDGNPTPEEIELVLYVLRLGSSDRERRVLDYLIDKECENAEKTVHFSRFDK